ncbi:hypothetical protein [Thalassobellus suaedae]|uniref:Right handed beta helix domain-containing protein n=1 Tax=Thalassobellus suaedae TaxID=3074124 RepID=A0ABY9XWC5_9FLAO|nr:hypothetical protein RHP51_04980 [Flavobacteriaceae bacterium HL-DH14]
MKNLLYIFLLITSITFSQSDMMMIASQAQFANEVGGGLDLSSANVRFIVGNSASLTTTDLAVKSILDSNTGTVQVTQPSNMNSITNHDFTVIAESITSSGVSGLKLETKPIITLEGGNWDEFNIGGAGSSTASLANCSLVNTHPITTGVAFPIDYNIDGLSQSQGTVFIGTIATSSAYISNNTFDSGAHVIIAFDIGDTLEDSSIASEKRIFISGFNAQFWSGDIQTIFINSMKWCYGVSI